MLPIDPRLIRLLEQDEDVRYFVYDDATGNPIVAGYTVKGNPTIGVGRAINHKKGLSRLEIRFLLENDIIDWNAQLYSFDWYRELDSVRRAVIISMMHTLGVRGFSRFKRFIAAMEAKDYAKAAIEMKDSSWAIQVGKRDDRLAEMLKTGAWPDSLGAP